jgi:hypothetical protein
VRSAAITLYPVYLAITFSECQTPRRSLQLFISEYLVLKVSPCGIALWRRRPVARKWRLFPQDKLTGARIRQSDVFEGLDQP